MIAFFSESSGSVASDIPAGHLDSRAGSRNGSARQKPGFTLIELMVVVAILGILATLAIAAFNGYVRRSKTAEATGNLNELFKSAASYYQTERTSQGVAATITGHCTVASESINPSNPGGDKQRFTVTAGYEAIGFSMADYVYYGYGINSADGRCGWQANTDEIYTFYAYGDLDGDGERSTFELAVGSDDSNTLYHARGFYVAQELE